MKLHIVETGKSMGKIIEIINLKHILDYLMAARLPIKTLTLLTATTRIVTLEIKTQKSETKL